MAELEDLTVVERPMFAWCMGDAKYVTPGDYLCRDCMVITEAEYIEDVTNRYQSDVSEAHARLQRALSVCAKPRSVRSSSTESNKL